MGLYPPESNSSFAPKSVPAPRACTMCGRSMPRWALEFEGKPIHEDCLVDLSPSVRHKVVRLPR